MDTSSTFTLDWKKLLSPQRFEEPSLLFEPHRSPFSQDADRILFSESFRRLAKKSQVHPLADNDHLHNRLIHSLEVASAGRSLGFIAGNFLLKSGKLDEVKFNSTDGETISKKLLPVFISEIVYAACLAHDLGNPPFGHAGEEAIRAWFLDTENAKYLEPLESRQRSDFTGFDGNAQSFRIIHKLEMYYQKQGGMRLTYPTIAAMVKYPWSSYKVAAQRNSKIKYNHHDAEYDDFNKVFSTLGLSVSSKKHLRHPLSYLSEAADDICYSIMDLEDAYELRIISFKDFVEVYKDIGDVKKVAEKKSEKKNVRIKHIRSIVIKHFIHHIGEIFKEKYDKIMTGELKGGLIDELPCKFDQIAKAKKLAREKIFNERRKIELEVGAYNIYQTLLNAFIPACDDIFSSKETHKYKHLKAKELLEASFKIKFSPETMTRYEAYMHVIDYITGSTDAYATFLGKQFLGAGMGPWQA